MQSSGSTLFMRFKLESLPDWSFCMNNPLENDIKRGPEEEVRDPKPREPLK